MKNKLFLVLGMACAAHLASAQANLKIGYTNVDYVLSQMPESKQIESDLKTFRTQLETQLQTKIKDFQAKADAYKRGAQAMSETMRATEEKDLQAQQTSIQSFQTSAEESLQKKQTSLLAPVLEKINKAIKDVATENAYTYVFNMDLGTNTVPVILHAPDEGNVSDLVLKKMGVTPKPVAPAQKTPASPAQKAPAPPKK